MYRHPTALRLPLACSSVSAGCAGFGAAVKPYSLLLLLLLLLLLQALYRRALAKSSLGELSDAKDDLMAVRSVAAAAAAAAANP